MALGLSALILSTVLACGGDSKSQYDDLNWCNANIQDALVELEEDANIDAKIYEDGATLVHQVARCNEDPSVVTLLLDRGADIDARDDHGQSPLHNAARYNQEPSVIEVLLDGGAEIDARGDIGGGGNTPLHEAAGFNEEPAVTALLLDRGAEIDAKGIFGRTLLHSAAKSMRHVRPAFAEDMTEEEIRAEADADLVVCQVAPRPCQGNRILI